MRRYVNERGFILAATLMGLFILEANARSRFRSFGYEGAWGDVAVYTFGAFAATVVLTAAAAVVLAVRGRLRRADTLGVTVIAIGITRLIIFLVGLHRFLFPLSGS